MTEQPVETEQQFLGNDPHPARLQEAILLTFAGKPLDEGQKAALDKFIQRRVPVLQHHVPNAHRFAPPKLTRPARDNTTAVILFDASVAAAAKLLNARKASEQAEEALKAALAAENLADIDSVEADRKLLDYVREVAAQ